MKTSKTTTNFTTTMATNPSQTDADMKEPSPVSIPVKERARLRPDSPLRITDATSPSVTPSPSSSKKQQTHPSHLIQSLLFDKRIPIKHKHTLPSQTVPSVDSSKSKSLKLPPVAQNHGQSPLSEAEGKKEKTFSTPPQGNLQCPLILLQSLTSVRRILSRFVFASVHTWFVTLSPGSSTTPLLIAIP
jgi:hypothetical protein